MSDLLLDHGFLATPHRFLWHPATGTAIISDLHLGIEQSLNHAGIAVPAMNIHAMQAAWAALVERLASAATKDRPARLVIAGDIFDSRVPSLPTLQEASTLLSQLPDTVHVVLIPGNHDPSAEELRLLYPDPRVEIQDHAVVGGYTVIHGDDSLRAQGRGRGRWQDSGTDRRWIPAGLIVGHQHPCVVLSNRVQSAKMICFACGHLPTNGESTSLIILPAFSPAPLGSNLLTERNWILDLPRPANPDLRIAGIVERGEDGQVLDFGTLADL